MSDSSRGVSPTAFVERVDTPQELYEDDIFQTLLHEYERVVVTSLITSFGLEFILDEAYQATLSDALHFDQYGGDVDTIHNVRQIGPNSTMTYKSAANEDAYASRSAYDSGEYHRHQGYQRMKHDARASASTIEDAYTGKVVAFTKGGTPETRADLDHVLSAKWIHDDPGRVLAGVDGPAIANDSSNLRFTNQHINRSMKADSIPEWLERHEDEVTPEMRERMMAAHEGATRHYEATLAAAYYTSAGFAKDLGKAAGRQSAMMAARQVCGLVLAEIWFAIKERIEETELGFNPAELAKSFAQGTEIGFTRAKDKYRELLSSAANGALAGALASVTNTLANIFMTTSKSMGKVIRESYASLVDAARVLIVNPEGYLFGERLRAAAKIIATGASVVLGTAVMDAVSRTPIAAVPYVGEAVQSFCGALVTGLLSCTLLLYLDRSEWINRLVTCLNDVPTIELKVEQMRLETEALTKYAAVLAAIDYDVLEHEIAIIESTVSEISSAATPEELNFALKAAASAIGIAIPWEGNFDAFMMDPTAHLHFS